MSAKPSSCAAQAASLAPAEVARFAAIADQFWDPRGAFSMLHRLAPLRQAYLLDQVRQHFPRQSKGDSAQPFRGLSILDIGCGGGLLAEPLARLGAKVTGVDAAKAAIDVAQAHAESQGLAIDYRVGTAEEVAQGRARFDVIVGLEIVEHVANLSSFMKAVASLLKPGGLLILSSVNKTRRGFLLGVVVAEYLLGWVPPGTHDWEKFQRPSDLIALAKPLGLTPLDVTGMVFDPLKRQFVLSAHRTAVNYFLTLSREKLGAL